MKVVAMTNRGPPGRGFGSESVSEWGNGSEARRFAKSAGFRIFASFVACAQFNRSDRIRPLDGSESESEWVSESEAQFVGSGMRSEVIRRPVCEIGDICGFPEYGRIRVDPTFECLRAQMSDIGNRELVQKKEPQIAQITQIRKITKRTHRPVRSSKFKGSRVPNLRNEAICRRR
jgi:hypothetical protein